MEPQCAESVRAVLGGNGSFVFIPQTQTSWFSHRQVLEESLWDNKQFLRPLGC